MRTVEVVELPLAVARGAVAADLRQQVAEQLRDAVRQGFLAPGQRLPSSRALAAHLRVSRGTVVAAITELEGEGWLEAKHGSGTYVSPALDEASFTPVSRCDAPPRAVAVQPGSKQRRSISLVPGQPDTTTLVDAAWRQAWREATAKPQSSHESLPAGSERLRAALAAHLRRARGLRCAPEDIVVTAGTSDALRLLADAVGLAGQVAAVEDPGYPTAWAILRRVGAGLHPVEVDAQGVVPSSVQATPPRTRMLYVTPSHQYPTGGLLPVDRRVAVLSWAAAHDVLVVEDDYDAEFRFGSRPVPALASLDTAGCVAYVGTLSKVVTPAVRLGFIVASPAVVDAVVAVRADMGSPVAGVVQDAMERYVAGGGMRRHIARQRRLYAERRARLVRRIEGLPGVAEVSGLDAGLHAVVALEPGRRGQDVVASAARAGIEIADLDYYRVRPRPDSPGVVLGYGHVSPTELDHALDVLTAVLQ